MAISSRLAGLASKTETNAEWKPVSGDVLRSHTKLGENLSGMFVDEYGRLLLSWPEGMFKDHDGFLEQCNSCCLLSIFCPLCIPCHTLWMCDVGHMNYLVLEPTETKGTLRGQHYRGTNYGQCPWGVQPSVKEVVIARARLDASEESTVLKFFPTAIFTEAYSSTEFEDDTPPCVKMELKNLLKDDGTISHSVYPGSERNWKLNAGYGFLSAVEAMIAGESPVYDQHPASCVKSATASSFAWTNVSASEWSEKFDIGSKATLDESDKATISSKVDSCGQRLCECLCMTICFPLCFGCWWDGIATARQRTFVTGPAGGVGDGVRLDVYEAPQFPGACPCCVPRARGPKAPRCRGGFRVTNVETQGDNGLLVFTSQLSVFSLYADRGTEAAANINTLLERYGRSTYGVDRDDGIAAKPIQASMMSSAGMKAAITRNKSTGSVSNNTEENNPDGPDCNVEDIFGPPAESIGVGTGECVDDAAKEPPKLSKRKEAECKAKLIRDLLKAFSDGEVQKAVEEFAAVRGSSSLSVDVLSASMCAVGLLRMNVLGSMFSKHCSSPFSSTLIAQAINTTLKTRERAEGIAKSMAPYVMDPDKFEETVIDGTMLKDTSPSDRKTILDRLPQGDIF